MFLCFQSKKMGCLCSYEMFLLSLAKQQTQKRVIMKPRLLLLHHFHCVHLFLFFFFQPKAAGYGCHLGLLLFFLQMKACTPSTRTAFNSALPHWKGWSCKLLWGTQWSLVFCSHQNAESLRSSEMTPGAEETRAFWWPETSTTVLLSRMILLTAFMSEVKHCTFFLLLF